MTTFQEFIVENETRFNIKFGSPFYRYSYAVKNVAISHSEYLPYYFEAKMYRDNTYDIEFIIKDTTQDKPESNIVNDSELWGYAIYKYCGIESLSLQLDCDDNMSLFYEQVTQYIEMITDINFTQYVHDTYLTLQPEHNKQIIENFDYIKFLKHCENTFEFSGNNFVHSFVKSFVNVLDCEYDLSSFDDTLTSVFAVYYASHADNFNTEYVLSHRTDNGIMLNVIVYHGDIEYPIMVYSVDIMTGYDLATLARLHKALQSYVTLKTREVLREYLQSIYTHLSQHEVKYHYNEYIQNIVEVSEQTARFYLGALI